MGCKTGWPTMVLGPYSTITGRVATVGRGSSVLTAGPGRFSNLGECNMKNKTNPLLLPALALLVMACGLFRPCKYALETPRTNFIGNALKLSGYYYGNPDGDIPPFVDVCFFYQNGVFFFLAAPLEEAQSGNLGRHLPANLANEGPYGLGVFRVEGRNLIIERWELNPPNTCNWTRLERGEVLNDTTFVIRQQEIRTGRRQPEFREVNQRFVFRRYAPKPDSINSFIQ
jgi:hypothetical protein